MKLSKKKNKYWDYVKDFIDMNYLNKLSPKDKEFMNKFIMEYYLNMFKNDGTDLHDVAKIPRTKVYATTNARQRDIWNKGEARYCENDTEIDVITRWKRKNDGNNENEDAAIEFCDIRSGKDEPPKKTRKRKK